MGSIPNAVKNGGYSRTWCHLRLEGIEGHTLEGWIPMPLIPGTFQHPDVSKIQQIDAQWLENSIIEAGLQPKGNTIEERREFICDMATMGAHFLPSMDLNADSMKFFMWLLTLSFLGDDVLEGKDILGRDNTNALLLATTCGDIFLGKYETFESIPFSDDSFGLKSMLKAGFVAAQLAKSHIPNFFKSSAYFAEATTLAYSAMAAFEYEDHYVDDLGDLPIDSYKFLRKHEGGFGAIIELALLCGGAIPTSEMRRNVLFQRIMDLAWGINVNVNDVMSVRKELDSGIGYNLVVYKSRQMELPIAFDSVIQMISEDMENFQALTMRYRLLSNHDELVEKVIRILEDMIEGHIRWFSTNKRYGSINIQFVEKS